MKKDSAKFPTQLELEILKVLWTIGPSPVRDVRDELAEVRDLAYTSVMTVMNIMTKKGFLKRRKKGNSFIYRSVVNRETTTSNMVGDLVDRLFEGSTDTALLHLLEISDIDDGELDRLRELIERKGEAK
jgi:predicted transcriptional regulator